VLFSPGGAVLDIRPWGPTQTHTHMTLPNPLQGESQEGSGAGQVGVAMQGSLQALGFRSRATTEAERRERLEGWALYEDVPSTRRPLAAGRLAGDSSVVDDDYRAVVARFDATLARMIIAAADNLFKDGPEPAAAAIQKALDAYQSQAGDVPELEGAQFAEWLSNRPAEEDPEVAGPDAQVYLASLRSFLEGLEGIGLTDKELTSVKTATLSGIVAGLSFANRPLTLGQLETLARNVEPKARPEVIVPPEPEVEPEVEAEPELEVEQQPEPEVDIQEPEADWKTLSIDDLRQRIKEDAEILTKLATQIRGLKVLLAKEKDAQAQAKLWETLKKTQAGYDRGMARLTDMVKKINP